jgi:hypothetical protein
MLKRVKLKVSKIVLMGSVALVLAYAAPATQDWTHFVRISGNGLSLDRVDRIIQEARETHVFGIETDNDIPGRYESFLNPAEKLEAIKAVAVKVHAAGNYAFVYIAGLECITAHADQAKHTLFKDHPDWVQRKITGEPAVFGGGTAFWIRPGDEDVWVSPYAPDWRRTYMERVRQIAATGIDGVYVDIPYWMTHFRGWEDTWASFDRYTVAAFQAKTGLNVRSDVKLGDYNDPGFRRWIDFRIATLTDFMQEIDSNVKAVNPRCVTIAEIYPGIEDGAVRVGADVYQLYGVVDAIAHEYEWEGGGTRSSTKTALDWLHYLIGMYTFRAFAADKATWMLSYSWDGEKNIDRREAMKNLFMAQVMAGTNCWDARGHVMSGSNDVEARKEIFGWIAQHERTFYLPRTPVEPIGVYFSPPTRNYFARDYLPSYLGTMALLLHSHREFQVVTPRTLRAYHGPILILADARCLDDQELTSLEAYTQSGGRLVVTGQTGRYAGAGQLRPSNALLAFLAIKDSGRTSAAVGKIKFVYLPNDPGRAYQRRLSEQFNQAAVKETDSDHTFAPFRAAFERDALAALDFAASVQVTASPFVTAQIARVDGKLHVYLANFKGLRARQSARQIPERDVGISFPARAGTRVFALPYLGQVQQLSVERKGERLQVVIPELDKGMVVWCE